MSQLRRYPRTVLVGLTLTVAVSIVTTPCESAAQSAILSTVADATNGVLPGVTTEARSPALIEQVRTAVTDSQG